MHVAGSISVPPESARAEGGDAPGHAVQAPADAVALLDYLMQPPGGDGSGGEEDSVPRIERPTQGGQPQTQQPSSGGTFHPPGGSAAPDSAKRTSPFNNPNFGDTLTAGFGQHRAQETAPPPPGARRGVLGLHPLAILVGLIALDIFVVSVAAK